MYMRYIAYNNDNSQEPKMQYIAFFLTIEYTTINKNLKRKGEQ